MTDTNDIKKGLVVLLASDCFGDGERELGQNLMKAFLYSQSEAYVKPETIIFINDGVKLTTKGSQVLEHLQALEDAGVQLFTCGACLNYYDIEDDLEISEITNMYSVTEMLNEAESVVRV